MIGTRNKLNIEIEFIKKKYSLRVNTNVVDYVGFQMIQKKDAIYLHQDLKIKKLLLDFKDQLKIVRKPKSPMDINTHIVRETDDERYLAI